MSTRLRKRVNKYGLLDGRPTPFQLPRFIVFTDRGSDTEWVLSHASSGGLVHIALNDEGLQRNNLPDHKDVIRVGREGLYMGRGVNLFVRDGRLGYEMVSFDTVSWTVSTRVGVQRTSYRLVIPSSWTEFPDVLGWIEENTYA